MSTHSETSEKSRRSFFLIVLGFLAGGALSVIATLALINYSGKGVSFWRFDPTPLHKDQVELSLEESARPDKQFIEVVVPYQRNLAAIANQASEKAQSEQVKTLAKTVLATQEQIQANSLDKLYKDWYKTDLDLRRLGLDSEPTSLPSQSSQAPEEIDREFLRHMIQNERMAVKLAFLVVDNAQNPAIRTMSQNIIKKQGAEVTILHDALADLHPVRRSTIAPTNSGTTPGTKSPGSAEKMSSP